MEQPTTSHDTQSDSSTSNSYNSTRSVSDIIFCEHKAQLVDFPDKVVFHFACLDCRVCAFLSAFYSSLTSYYSFKCLNLCDIIVAKYCHFDSCHGSFLDYIRQVEHFVFGYKCNDYRSDSIGALVSNPYVVPHFHRYAVKDRSACSGLTPVRFSQFVVYDGECTIGQKGCRAHPSRRAALDGAHNGTLYTPTRRSAKTLWSLNCQNCQILVDLNSPNVGYFLAFVLGQGRISVGFGDGLCWKHLELDSECYIDEVTTQTLFEYVPVLFTEAARQLYRNGNVSFKSDTIYPSTCHIEEKDHKLASIDIDNGKTLCLNLNLHNPHMCHEATWCTNRAHSFVIHEEISGAKIAFNGEYSEFLSFLFTGSHISQTDNTSTLKNFCLIPHFDVYFNEDFKRSLFAKSQRLPIMSQRIQPEGVVVMHGEAQMFKGLGLGRRKSHKEYKKTRRPKYASERSQYTTDGEQTDNSDSRRYESEPLVTDDESTSYRESQASTSVKEKKERWLVDDVGTSDRPTSTIVVARNLFERLGASLLASTTSIRALHSLWDWPLEQCLDYHEKVAEGLLGLRISTKPSRTLAEFQQNKFPALVNIVEEMNEQMKVLTERDFETNKKNLKIFQELEGKIHKLFKELESFNKITMDNFAEIRSWVAANSAKDVRPTVFPKLKAIEKELEAMQREIDSMAKKANFFDEKDPEEYGNIISKDLVNKFDQLSRDLNKKMDKISQRLSTNEENIKLIIGDLDNMRDVINEEIPARGNPQGIVPKRDATMPRSIRGKKEMDAGKPSVLETHAGGFAEEVSRTSGLHGIHVANVEEDVIQVPEGTMPVSLTNQVLSQMQSPVHLGTVIWKSASPEGQTLAYYNFPEAIFQKSPFLSLTYSAYQYYVCDGIEISFDVTSAKGQGGLLTAFWDPLSTAVKGKQLHLFQLQSLFKVEIFAGTSGKYTMVIPFESILNHLSLQGEEYTLLSMGTVLLVPTLHLLSSSGKDDSVTVRVSARFKNPRFKMLTIPHQNPANLLKQVDVLGGGVFGVLKNFRVGTKGELIHIGKWSSADTGLLMHINVHPGTCRVEGDVVYPGTLSMLSQMFKLWRGSLRFVMTFATNLVSSGRLFLVALPAIYTMEDLPMEQALLLEGVEYNLSYENNKVDIEVPFVGISDYQRSLGGYMFDSQYHGEALKVRLHVYVTSPLVCDVGSISSIDFMVNVFPGDDFEFKGPIGINIGIPYFTRAQIGLYQPDPAIQHLELSGDYKLITSNFSPFLIFKLQHKQAFGFKVAPCYRQINISDNATCWLASMFARWFGTIEYEFSVAGFNRAIAREFRVWYLPEAETPALTEWSMWKQFTPPPGMKYIRWDPHIQTSKEIAIKMTSRFKSLMVPKKYIPTGDVKNTCFYNGMVVIGYWGADVMEVRLQMRAGDDLQFFDRSALPKLGKNEGCLTNLPYGSKLSNVTSNLKDHGVTFSASPSTFRENAVLPLDLPEGFNAGTILTGPNEESKALDDGRNFGYLPVRDFIQKKKEEVPVQQVRSTEGQSEVAKEELPPPPSPVQKSSTRPKFRGFGQFEGFVESSGEDPWMGVTQNELFEAVSPFINGEKEMETGQAEMKGMGAYIAGKILGDQQVEALQRLDMDKIVDNVNEVNKVENFGELLGLISKMKELDTAKFMALINQATPMVEQVQNFNVSSFMSGFDEATSPLFTISKKLGALGLKMIEFLETLIDKNIFVYTKGLFENNKVVFGILLSNLGFVCLMRWYQLDANLITKLLSLLMIIWLPLIGHLALSLHGWVTTVLLPVVKEYFAQLNFGGGRKEGCSRNESAYGCTGEAEMDFNFLLGDNFVYFLRPILYLSSGLTALVSLSRLPTKAETQTFYQKFKAFGDVSRAATSISGVLKLLHEVASTFASKVVEWINTLAGKTVTASDIVIEKLTGFNVRQWMSEVDDLSLEENKFVGVNDVERVDRVRAMYDKAKIIKNVMVSNTFPAGLVSVINTTIKKATDLVNESHTCKGLGEFRIDPFHLSLHGAPGVGKSTVLSILLHDIMDYLGYPRTDRTYSRSAADQYWSRYYNQPAVIMDDLGALVGSPEQSDVGELIGLKSNQPMSLNMAAVEEKGRMFTSHLLFSTTNMPHLDDQSNVRCKEAFHRRRDLLVRVERDPNVPRDLEDPTKGLLFYVEDSRRGGIRTDWSEAFWQIPNFQIAGYDYNTFVQFCCIYAGRYLKAQRALVEQNKKLEFDQTRISTLREEIERALAIIEEDEVVEALDALTPEQVGVPLDMMSWAMENGIMPTGVSEVDKPHFKEDSRREDSHVVELTVDQICEYYASLNVTALQLSEIFERLFNYHEEAVVKLGRETNLLKIVGAFCQCPPAGEDKMECAIEIIKYRLLEHLGSPQIAGYTIHQQGGPHNFVVRFVKINDCKGEYKEVEAMRCVCSLLAGIVNFQELSGVCPLRVFDLRNGIIGNTPIASEIEESSNEVAMEFPSTGTMPHICDGVKWCKWEKVLDFYPECKDFGGICLNILGSYIWISPEDMPLPENYQEQAELCMTALKSCPSKKNFKEMFKQISSLDLIMLKSCLDFGRIFDNETGHVKGEACEIMEEAKEYFEGSPVLVVWYLALLEEEKRLALLDIQASETKIKMSKWKRVVDKYKAEEEKLMAKASSPVKIALTVAGAILGLAGFAGTIFGIYKAVGWIFGLGGQSKKLPVMTSEEKVEVGPPVLSDEEQEDLVREGQTMLEKDVSQILNFEGRPSEVHDFAASSGKIHKFTEDYIEVPKDVAVEKEMSYMTSGDFNTRRVAMHKNSKAMSMAKRIKNQHALKQISLDGSGDFKTKRPRNMKRTLRLQPGGPRLATGIAQVALGRALNVEDLPEDYLVKFNIRVDSRMMTQDDLIDIDKWQKAAVDKGLFKGLPEPKYDVEIFEGSQYSLVANDIGFVPLKIDLDFDSQRAPCSEGAHIEDKNDYKLPESVEIVSGQSKKLLHTTARPGRNVYRQTLKYTGEPQIAKDSGVLNLCENVLLRASAYIYCPERDAGGNCIRVVGSWILIPAHYAFEFDDGSEVCLLFSTGFVRFQWLNSHSYLLGRGQDLMLHYCGPRVPQAANIIGHFCTLKDIAEYVTSPGCLVFTAFSQHGSHQVIEVFDRMEMTVPDVSEPTLCYDMGPAVGKGMLHTIVSGMRYKALTNKGWCGSFVVRCNTKQPRKIVGIHVAAASTHLLGFAEIVLQEFLLETLGRAAQDGLFTIAAVSPTGEKELHIHTEDPVKQMTQLPHDISVLGFVEKKELPMSATNTEIEPSMLYDLIGKHATEPSILHSWDGRLSDRKRPDKRNLRGLFDPVVDAVEKYGVDVHVFDQCKVDRVTQFLKAHFKNKENSLYRRQLLSLDETINGIDSSDMWDQINMMSSCGYPYVKRRPAGEIGKKFLFEEVGTYPSGRPQFAIKDQELVERYTQRVQNAVNGQRSETLTVECAKDERRKLKKIYEDVATRTFTNLPLDLNLAYRTFFLDFAVMVMETRSESFCKVGINPNSLEWSEMINQFYEVGDYGFAGDYAKFDGIGTPEIYHAIVDVINAWYGDSTENQLARHVLISECYHRKTAVRNAICEVHQGIPSGFSMTVIFNCFVNFYYMCMAWCDLLEETSLKLYANPASFDAYTKIATYGDDNVISVCPDALPYFNLRTVAQWLAEYGITYTDDAKRPIEESEKYVPIEECSFLKRKFVKSTLGKSLWKAPLDKISIEEQIMWVRKSLDERKAVTDNIKNALFEASIHGKEYYEDLYARVKIACDMVLLDMPLTSFELETQRWLDDHNMKSRVTPDFIKNMGKVKEIPNIKKDSEGVKGYFSSLLEMQRKSLVQNLQIV